MEKLAIDMPEVCVMDQLIDTDFPTDTDIDGGGVFRFFSRTQNVELPKQRCSTIISKSRKSMGE